MPFILFDARKKHAQAINISRMNPLRIVLLNCGVQTVFLHVTKANSDVLHSELSKAIFDIQHINQKTNNITKHIP